MGDEAAAAAMGAGDAAGGAATGHGAGREEGREDGLGPGRGLRWFCSIENANVFLRLSGYEVVTLTRGWVRRV